MENKNKRLFFGLEVHAPWPDDFPDGRLLDEKERHLTLAFLGSVAFKPLLNDLERIFLPHLTVGSTGYFNQCLFLPPNRPSVISWHSVWWEKNSYVFNIQKELATWLFSKDYEIDKRPWLPHVTLCRSPFDSEAWKNQFSILPFYTSHLHLYESFGHSQYRSIWSIKVELPFEEMDHTADMAFKIRGENLYQVYHNAFSALAFKIPGLIEYFKWDPILKELDDIIITLNEIIGKMDGVKGCPLKAVSFHGNLIACTGYLEWEMIIDV